MKPSAIFLSNSIYFDDSKKEGGVKLCTREYLELIKILFNVTLFPVDYHIDISYRIRVKLGLNAYNDYRANDYRAQIAKVIKENNTSVVFLNLSNTAGFAEIIKNEFGNKVKVVLCSHGNESGDYLHEATRLKKQVSFHRTLLSSYTLGSMLKKEAVFRQSFIDGVLTVSPIEEALEKWLGAKQVLMIPRTVIAAFVTWQPIAGRVGFMGDLSHWPNYFGISEVCKALHQSAAKGVEVRIVGTAENAGFELEKTYPFVKYTGYLNELELEQEISSWSAFLNPVFYYSRGVSTKLAKAFGWGLPVITTSIGCRGYEWKHGSPVFAESPVEMATKINNEATDTNKMKEARTATLELVKSSTSLDNISKDLHDFLESIG
jgi:glycosyltransferase involved in cell wall biosynthesis